MPETVARFFRSAADYLGIEMKEVRERELAFRLGRLPLTLYELARGEGWRLPPLAKNYDRITFERRTGEEDPRFEWITPGHPLFEAVRRKVEEDALSHLQQGVVFYDLHRGAPGLLELYVACVADGTGKILHQRLFLVETSPAGERRLREPTYLLDLVPAEETPSELPGITVNREESETFLYQRALQSFLAEVMAERQKDLNLVERHVRLCFEELIRKRDEILNRHLLAKEQGDPGVNGLIEIESQKLLELQRRRDRRLEELKRQRALSLQGLQRLGVALVLPHPARALPEVSCLVPDPATERRAMEAAIAYEQARGCRVEDVHAQNLGYDLRSLNPETGELRLIEVKGLGGATGTICLTPHERRVAEDRRDVYWLYVVTNCDTRPTLQEPIPDPARLPWHEVKRVDHYRLTVDALTPPMQIHEEDAPYEVETE